MNDTVCPHTESWNLCDYWVLPAFYFSDLPCFKISLPLIFLLISMHLTLVVSFFLSISLSVISIYRSWTAVNVTYLCPVIGTRPFKIEAPYLYLNKFISLGNKCWASILWQATRWVLGVQWWRAQVNCLSYFHHLAVHFERMHCLNPSYKSPLLFVLA